MLIFCTTREKYEWTSRNFTSKVPENQVSLYVLRIWIHSFDVPFKAPHSLPCVFSGKTDQTVCPIKSLWQQKLWLIPVSLITVAFHALYGSNLENQTCIIHNYFKCQYVFTVLASVPQRGCLRHFYTQQLDYWLFPVNCNSTILDSGTSFQSVTANCSCLS